MFEWLKKKKPKTEEEIRQEEENDIREAKKAIKEYPELQAAWDKRKSQGHDDYSASLATLCALRELKERAKDPEAYDRAQREREEAQRNARLRREMQEMQARQRELDLSKRPGAVQCPYCKSYDTTKITAGSRVASAVMWGVASNKLGKQWHCNKCKSNF